MLAGDILRLSARNYPNKTALIQAEREITYAELDEAANRFGNAVLGLGLAKGDRLAVMCANIPEYGVVHFGAARTGCVQVHMSGAYGPDEITQILNQTRARLIVVEDAFQDRIAGLRDRLEHLEHVIVVGRPDTPGAQAFDAFIAAAPDARPEVDIAESDPRGMTFTGGTPGLPKGAVVSHCARYVSAYTVIIEHELTSDDVVAAVTPLYHAVGLLIWFQAAMLAGCTTVLIRRWDAGEFVDACDRHGITAVMTVPVQLNAVLSDEYFDAGKLRTLRKIGCGGANVPAEVIADGRKKLPGVRLIDHYGQSETGLLTMLKPWHPADKNGTIGLPALGVDLRVLTPDGAEAAPGEIGEIVVSGAFMFDGYFENPEETAAYFKGSDGWGWTGDLATVDADGFITLAGRSKDMIVSGGVNIYPREVELVLERHEAVAECTVFGVPDEKWGEALVALVVARPDAAIAPDALPAALIDYCGRRVARFKSPREIRVVDEIPRTPAGKIQKPKLREAYLNETG